MLRTYCSWVPVGWFCVWIECTSIKLSMAKFSILAGFEVDFERIVDVVFEAENLLVHVDAAIMDA